MNLACYAAPSNLTRPTAPEMLNLEVRMQPASGMFQTPLVGSIEDMSVERGLSSGARRSVFCPSRSGRWPDERGYLAISKRQVANLRLCQARGLTCLDRARHFLKRNG